MATIQEILDHYNLGILREGYDTYHAYGETDKGNQVWLPIVSVSQDWINRVVKHKCKKYVLQRGISGTSNQNKAPGMITSIVITRNKATGKYKKIGKYKQILFDQNRRFTIHAKVCLFKKCCCCKTKPLGNSVCDGNLVYDPNFFKTAQKAKKKADYFWNKYFNSTGEQEQ